MVTSSRWVIPKISKRQHLKSPDAVEKYLRAGTLDDVWYDTATLLTEKSGSFTLFFALFR
jgi:hypothetical protein